MDVLRPYILQLFLLAHSPQNIAEKFQFHETNEIPCIAKSIRNIIRSYKSAICFEHFEQCEASRRINSEIRKG